jgi:hypothetical protein
MYARRYLRLRNALAVALAAVLVLVAIACGQSSGVIPWLNHHPAPVKAPPAAPPCRVADLSVHFEFGVSATDPSAARNHRVPSLNMNGFFIIANEGRRACSLAGRPQLKLIDPQVRKPRLLEKYSVPAKPALGSLESLTPLSLLRAVPPHQRAALGFNWKNWCGPGPAPRAIELRPSLEAEISAPRLRDEVGATASRLGDHEGAAGGAPESGRRLLFPRNDVRQGIRILVPEGEARRRLPLPRSVAQHGHEALPLRSLPALSRDTQ